MVRAGRKIEDIPDLYQRGTRWVVPRILFAGVLLITGLLLLFAVAVPFLLAENRERTGHHVIGYSVRISSDTPLDNLTLLLPLPSVNGTSVAGKGLAYGSGYGVPEGWNMTLERQNGSQFLKITGAQFMPERAPYPVPADEGSGENGPHPQDNLTIQPIPLATKSLVTDSRNGSGYAVGIGPDANATIAVRELPVLRPVEFGVREMMADTIETRDPFGAEPLLEPKENLRETGCTTPVPKTARCFAYTSPVYIDYQSDGPADIEISVSVHASNEWWELGWSSNSYTDRVFVSPTEGRKGWVTADGSLLTGNGRY